MTHDEALALLAGNTHVVPYVLLDTALRPNNPPASGVATWEVLPDAEADSLPAPVVRLQLFINRNWNVGGQDKEAIAAMTQHALERGARTVVVDVAESAGERHRALTAVGFTCDSTVDGMRTYIFRAEAGGTHLAELVQGRSIHGSVQEGTLTSNDYRTDRGLEAYETMGSPEGGPSLTDLLRAAPQGSAWVDFGAGFGSALLGAIADGSFGNLHRFVGVSFKRPPELTDRALREGFEYIDGDLLHHLFAGGYLDSLRPPEDGQGGVAVATDFWGVATYTDDLQRDLGIELGLLAPNGTLTFSLPTQIQLKPQWSPTVQTTPLIVKLRRPDGAVTDVPQEEAPAAVARWLSRAEGIEVEGHWQHEKRKGDEFERSEVFRIRRSGGGPFKLPPATTEVLAQDKPPIRALIIDTDE